MYSHYVFIVFAQSQLQYVICIKKILYSGENILQLKVLCLLLSSILCSQNGQAGWAQTLQTSLDHYEMQCGTTGWTGVDMSTPLL